MLKEHITSEPHIRIEWRGSSYHQRCALYPVIDHLQRLLRGHHDAAPAEQLCTLEAALTASGVTLSEAVPLLAALLALPLPASYPPLTLTPQRQRQQTLAYDVVQAVVPLDTAALQEALAQLVAVEVVAQRGLPPQATYTFKHALIQDAAYQSLLRSTRQQYHQRMAQVVAERFPETAETQLEVLAYHYTAAGLLAQALGFWKRAGERALGRSAHGEAVACFEQALRPAFTRAHQERGNEAYALRLLGDIAARREPPDVAQAEAHYPQALALAGELGMRPLQAHCHHSLGTLYSQTGRDALARTAFSTAIELYRAMDMTFWLPAAESALAQVER